MRQFYGFSQVVAQVVEQLVDAHEARAVAVGGEHREAVQGALQLAGELFEAAAGVEPQRSVVAPTLGHVAGQAVARLNGRGDLRDGEHELARLEDEWLIVRNGHAFHQVFNAALVFQIDVGVAAVFKDIELVA